MYIYINYIHINIHVDGDIYTNTSRLSTQSDVACCEACQYKLSYLKMQHLHIKHLQSPKTNGRIKQPLSILMKEPNHDNIDICQYWGSVIKVSPIDFHGLVVPFQFKIDF